MLIMLIVSVTF